LVYLLLNRHFLIVYNAGILGLYFQMNYSTYIKGLANLGSTFYPVYHNPQHIKLVVVQKFAFRQSPVKHNSRVIRCGFSSRFAGGGYFVPINLVVSDGEGIAGAVLVLVLVLVCWCC
jgi:hypothetical protein